MKTKTALKQSNASVKFLGCVLPVIWALYGCFPHWHVLALSVLMTLFLIGDLVNIVLIKRRVRSDPGYLDKRID